jgi:hypothetical protein
MDSSNLWTRAGTVVRHATQLGEIASLAAACALGRRLSAPRRKPV